MAKTLDRLAGNRKSRARSPLGGNGIRSPMKIATWNVNGIRARQAEVEEWIAAERPDVVCLQEIKAAPEQIPASFVEIDGLLVLLARRRKGYSGVGLHVRRDSPREAGVFASTVRSRVRIAVARFGELTVASVYVPNGGKDFAAKMRFLEALDGYAATFGDANAPLVVCGDSTSRAPTSTCTRRSASRARSASCRKSERSSSGCSATAWCDVGRAARSRRTTSSSPGGRPGATCASATSAGASTTSCASEPLAARATMRAPSRDRHQRPRPARGRFSSDGRAMARCRINHQDAKARGFLALSFPSPWRPGGQSCFREIVLFVALGLGGSFLRRVLELEHLPRTPCRGLRLASWARIAARRARRGGVVDEQDLRDRARISTNDLADPRARRARSRSPWAPFFS